MSTDFKDPQVKAVFDSYQPVYRKPLLRLRSWTFQVARATEGVGELEETLKWNQPSYLTKQTRAGSTLRMDWFDDEHIALYFNCQTTLVDTFRTMYGDVLSFSGNRAIVINIRESLPEAPLKNCIEMALTYHLRKKRRAKSTPA